MPDLLPEASSPARDFAVASVRSIIVDVPTMRRHKLSQTSVTAQSYVIVQLRLVNGAEGVGEAATLGGPRWSEESVEAMKANIDAYLAPAILDQRADQFEAAGIRMDQAAKRNNAAKAAIETALFDAVGKSLNLPAAALLGGAVRDRFPVLWTLASGDPAQEVEEAERKLEARLHRTFKVKVGAQEPATDMARMRHLARALEGRAELIVDANQAWDETVAVRCLPQLAEMSVRLVEQPVPLGTSAPWPGCAPGPARRRCWRTNASSTHMTCWPSRRRPPPTRCRSSW